jgi:type III secretion apparatus needle protein
MSAAAFSSPITMDNLNNMLSEGISSVEKDMESQIQEVKNSGGNLNPADMLKLQIAAGKYTNIIQMETGLVKMLTDTMKQVAMNIGQ